MELYEKVRQIGRGSYGEAFLVKNKKTNEQFVLKTISLHGGSEDREKEAQKEVEALSRLTDHPFVIRYHQSFLENNILHIIMSYADGGNLQLEYKRCQKNKQQIPEADIVDWITQLLFSLQHVHDRCIIHRDIKCENVFLAGDRSVRLGDFGVCRILSNRNSLASTTVGTPYYMAPEIIMGKPYSNKSDIWALGVVIYELCKLERLFHADNLPALIMRIANESIPIPRISSTYSEELSEFVSQLLTRDPAARPSVSQCLAFPFLKTSVAKHYDILRKEMTLRGVSMDIDMGVTGSPSPDKRRATYEPDEAVTLNLDEEGSLVDSYSVTLHQPVVYGAVYIVGKNDHNLRLLSSKLPRNITDVACGETHALLLSEDGDVFVWGSSEHRALGFVGEVDLKEPRLLPHFSEEGVKIDTIAAGFQSSAAISTDGRLYLWGLHTGFRVPRLENSISDVTMVALGPDFTLALTSAGKLFAWGKNTEGQLGVGEDVYSASDPMLVNFVTHSNIKSIHASLNFSAALTDSGQLLTWGSNKEGVLGLGEDRIDEDCVCDPEIVTGLQDHVVLHVALGSSHMVCATANLQLWSWGKAGSWLGLGIADEETSPEDEFTFGDDILADSSEVVCSPTVVETFPKAPLKSLASGLCHSIAVLENGRVFSWGRNVDSSNGFPITTTGISSPTEMQACTSAAKHVVDVACANNFSLFRDVKDIPIDPR